MPTFQEVASLLEAKVKTYKKFKIGMTGQTAKERFDQEHCKNYSFYAEVGTSDNPTTVSQCEQFLIDYFKNYSNNDNKQGSAGDMGTSTRYVVYIVWS